MILATPTGSGKSLVAIAAHFAALADGRVTYYTAPIKALVSEKFFALCETFGARNVGMLTGDASVNSGAPIICCTAEILANIALREGANANVGQVVMDEFHFYGDPQRGWAWQVPLLSLPQAQFLLMSATLGDVTALREDLTRRTGRDTALIDNAERPVPLYFSWSLEPLHELLEELVRTDQAPIYVVHFTQASALERAQSLLSAKLCTREERDAIADAIGAFRFTAGFGRTLSKLVRSGIGVHHAGMLPRYRRLVEQLAQTGLLKVVCGTDTLGVGINVPIRTVVFTGLAKFDGTNHRLLKAREFHQIAGRAGRAGFDTSGYVVVQAPDHTIENARLAAKAGDDPKKQRRIQKKKAPEGVVSWTEETFERLKNATPGGARVEDARQPLDHPQRHQSAGGFGRDDARADGGQPRGRARPHGGWRSRPKRSPRSCSPPACWSGCRRRTRSAGRFSWRPRCRRTSRSISRWRRSPRPRSISSIRTPRHAAMDVLSVVEAILDDPFPVLMAQANQARGEAVAAMKADGIEYEERMELLEEITYPKPLEEPLQHALWSYRETHPWVLESDLSPKSVVRDMYESGRTFTEFIAYYGVARSEGLVLRYMTDTYRDAPPDGARVGQDRRVRRSRRVARRDRPPDRLQPARRVGGADRPRVGRARRGRRGRRRGAGPAAADHRQRARVPGDGPQRDVPEGAARRARPLRRARADRGGSGVESGERVVMNAAAWEAALGDYWDEHETIDTGPAARSPELFLIERASADLDGAPDHQRPRGPPRLGDRRHGRPRCLGRRRRARDPDAVVRAPLRSEPAGRAG